MKRGKRRKRRKRRRTKRRRKRRWWWRSSSSFKDGTVESENVSNSIMDIILLALVVTFLGISKRRVRFIPRKMESMSLASLMRFSRMKLRQ